MLSKSSGSHSNGLSTSKQPASAKSQTESSTLLNRNQDEVQDNSASSDSQLTRVIKSSIVKDFKRSCFLKEFGTENENSNCFLNVCLQALWQFQKVRYSLSQVTNNHDMSCSQEIKPFVRSLQEYFERLFDFNRDQLKTREVPVVGSTKVQVELFKLFYDQNQFQLHQKVDASEAFDYILTIIHAWIKTVENQKSGSMISLSDSSKLYCDEDNTCFIHANFCQSNIQQELCSCGKRSPVRYQDPNVFQFDINVAEVLEAFLSKEQKSVILDKEENSVLESGSQLISLLKKLMTQQRNGCIDDKSLSGHQTKTITCVEKNPEVFVFKANWIDWPTPSSIFKFMVSFPERFTSTSLFEDNTKETYVLKGIISYSFLESHYLSFFRRVCMKPGSGHQLTEQQSRQLESEVTGQTEWTMFNNESLKHQGSWQDVVKYCYELRTYPTMIFYEKLGSVDLEKPMSESYYSPQNITFKFRDSKKSDKDWDVDAKNEESAIEEQRKLLESYSQKKQEKRNSQQSGSGQKINQIQQLQSTPKQLTKSLKSIKKEFKQYGIYLYQCNNCQDGILTLHVPSCLKPGCKSNNNFFQESVCTDRAKWEECLEEICNLQQWEYTKPANQSNIYKQDQDSVGKQEIQLSAGPKSSTQQISQPSVSTSSLVTEGQQETEEQKQDLNQTVYQSELDKTFDQSVVPGISEQVNQKDSDTRMNPNYNALDFSLLSTSQIDIQQKKEGDQVEDEPQYPTLDLSNSKPIYFQQYPSHINSTNQTQTVTAAGPKCDKNSNKVLPIQFYDEIEQTQIQQQQCEADVWNKTQDQFYDSSASQYSKDVQDLQNQQLYQSDEKITQKQIKNQQDKSQQHESSVAEMPDQKLNESKSLSSNQLKNSKIVSAYTSNSSAAEKSVKSLFRSFGGAKLIQICKNCNKKTSKGAQYCDDCIKPKDDLSEANLRKSLTTSQPDSVSNRTKETGDSKEQQKPNYGPWICRKCNYENLMGGSGWDCFSCKTSREDQELQIQAEKEQQDSSPIQNINCIYCGHPKDLITKPCCTSCNSTHKLKMLGKLCVQCQKREKFKMSERCPSCKLEFQNELNSRQQQVQQNQPINEIKGVHQNVENELAKEGTPIQAQDQALANQTPRTQQSQVEESKGAIESVPVLESDGPYTKIKNMIVNQFCEMCSIQVTEDKQVMCIGCQGKFQQQNIESMMTSIQILSQMTDQNIFQTWLPRGEQLNQILDGDSQAEPQNWQNFGSSQGKQEQVRYAQELFEEKQPSIKDQLQDPKLLLAQLDQLIASTEEEGWYPEQVDPDYAQHNLRLYPYENKCLTQKAQLYSLLNSIEVQEKLDRDYKSIQILTLPKMFSIKHPNDPEVHYKLMFKHKEQTAIISSVDDKHQLIIKKGKRPAEFQDFTFCRLKTTYESKDKQICASCFKAQIKGVRLCSECNPQNQELYVVFAGETSLLVDLENENPSTLDKIKAISILEHFSLLSFLQPEQSQTGPLDDSIQKSFVADYFANTKGIRDYEMIRTERLPKQLSDQLEFIQQLQLVRKKNPKKPLGDILKILWFRADSDRNSAESRCKSTKSDSSNVDDQQDEVIFSQTASSYIDKLNAENCGDDRQLLLCLVIKEETESSQFKSSNEKSSNLSKIKHDEGVLRELHSRTVQDRKKCFPCFRVTFR